MNTQPSYKRQCESLQFKNERLQSIVKELKERISTLENISKLDDRLPKNAHEKIRYIIENQFKVNIDKPTRKQNVVDARRLYYVFLNRMLNYGLRQTAETLTLCHDHSTVIHAIKTHDDLMVDRLYRKRYNKLEEYIKQQLSIPVSINEEEYHFNAT